MRRRNILFVYTAVYTNEERRNLHLDELRDAHLLARRSVQKRSSLFPRDATGQRAKIATDHSCELPHRPNIAKPAIIFNSSLDNGLKCAHHRDSSKEQRK
jgi:hypothetical protein